MENKAIVHDSPIKLFVHSMTFGSWLRDQMRSRGMSNAELARRVGVSATYIGNLMRDFSPNTKSGKGRPSVQLVDKIAETINAEADEARLVAGYAPKHHIARPQNFAEFVEALESLGVEQFENFSGSRDLPPEEYELLLAQIRALIEIVATRRLPRLLDIDVTNDTDVERRKYNRGQ